MKTRDISGCVRRVLRAAGAVAAAWVALGLGGGAAVARADAAADLARVALEATGGPAAHEALSSFRAMGVTRVGDKEVTFILFAARPNRVRVESLGERGTLTRGFDGVSAPWRLTGAGAKPERMARAEERVFVREAEFDQPFFNFVGRGWSLDHGGEAKGADGKTYVRLLATSRRAETEWWYVDMDTLFITRRDKEGGKVRTFYSDYRAVAGVMLPGRIRVESGGRVLSDTTITDYAPNPPLPADFFAPPAPDWPRW